VSWARIDDAFDDHPKVLAVLEHDQGGAAIGLWTLCLTWAYRNTLKRGKEPGKLPAHLPRRYLGPAARELAALLVKEGLWEALGDGDGWQIHDFEHYLATPKTREARAEAGRKGAAARWGDRPGKGAGRDGNLPSGHSNLPSVDGKPMAADGKAGPEVPPDGGSAPQAGNPPPVDGNEPPTHGNLPSGLPFEGGKPMASDGSRAPARRAIPNGIAPVPGPEPVQPSAAANESRPDDATLSITQRSKRITDAYAAAEPMCKWPAVNGVVIKAIKSNRFADDEIRDALLRMAAENRSVTVDSLRTELAGLPARSRSGASTPAPGPDRARGWIAAGRAFQAEAEQAGKELPGGR
jgi:hypothetical protein